MKERTLTALRRLPRRSSRMSVMGVMMMAVTTLLLTMAVSGFATASSSSPISQSQQQHRQHSHRSKLVVPVSRRYRVGSKAVNYKDNEDEEDGHDAFQAYKYSILIALKGGADPSTTKSSGSSSVTDASFSLIKCMVGSGVLALPAGLAAISDFPSSLWPANVLLAGLAALSAYTFSLYGRLVHRTQARSLGDLWKDVYGSNHSFAISVANFVYCFGVLLTYSLVIGDSISSLVQATAGGMASSFWASRQAAILATTVTTVLPLCNLSSLAALAPVSIVGVAGSLVTLLFLGLRCPSVLSSSPYSLTATEGVVSYLDTLPASLRPLFRTYSRYGGPAPLVLMSMGCVALLAHFSAPDFYYSLKGNGNVNKAKRGQQASTTMTKFNTMTIASYAAVTGINALFMIFGFLTFGGNSAGIILNNYSTRDWGASLSRLLIAISVIGGYPFLMMACRSSALELWTTFVSGRKNKGQPPPPPTRSMEVKTTCILLSALTAIALVVKDAGFVVSFNGALMGSALIYIFPALLFLRQTSSTITGAATRAVRWERWFCKFLVAFGLMAAGIGGATSVMNSFYPHLLS